MASSSSSLCCSLLFHGLLLLQLCGAREIFDKTPKNDLDNVVKTEENHIKMYENNEHQDLDPALNVFFHVNDLYMGKKMPIYFAVNDPSTTPRLLAREQADSIPFSSLKLPYLLDLLSFSEDSPQAKAMELTLKQCELEPAADEIKFCASSLESMLDHTRGVLGMGRLKALTTKIHNSSNSNYTLLQGYTFLKEPLEMYAPNMVACHTMAYPYAVYYCHGQKNHNRLFEIALGGEIGNRVDAVAVCHMDTSMWDADHVAFRVLGGQPGSSPVCHFLPADNVAFVVA